MTRLARIYLMVFLLLVVGLLAVLADASATSRFGPRPPLTAFSTLPGNSLAVPYFEARWRVLGGNSDLVFPGMRNLSTMDFVYAP